MPMTEQQPHSSEEVLQLMELMQCAVLAASLEQFVQQALPTIAIILKSSWVALYIADSRMLVPHFFQHGLKPEAASNIHNSCAEQFNRLLSQGNLPVKTAAPVAQRVSASIIFHPLRFKDTYIGLIALDPHSNPSGPELWERLADLITHTINHFAERIKTERQLQYLNSYLIVSSMLAQSVGLHELMEAALYSSMEVVSGEAASVLLLSEDKKNLVFYQVEGTTKPLLMAATFPADKGIAGSVLQTQQSEVINDVLNDQRFYGNIDTKTGFRTRNMIVVPLVAGEEKVGVLEVLNKAGGGTFSEEERLLLCSIAEEIAFAIRNAKLFEYVANSYCKQRQGQASCKGCERPLSSWTPCVKYRQVDL